jgi:hypothetical protein
MKKFNLALIALCALLFSVQAQSGMTLGGLEQAVPNPDAQPNSKAFGKSLDEWIEAHLRWLEAGQDPDVRVKNVAFLPIVGDSPFSIEVGPGTALVLPIAMWLGFEGDPVLVPSDFFGAVTLDGQPIAEPNVDFLVGPTPVDPPLFGVVTFFQGLGVVIKPLTPGTHTIELFSSINTPEGLAEFTNTWNITVAPPGKK